MSSVVPSNFFKDRLIPLRCLGADIPPGNKLAPITSHVSFPKCLSCFFSHVDRNPNINVAMNASLNPPSPVENQFCDFLKNRFGINAQGRLPLSVSKIVSRTSYRSLRLTNIIGGPRQTPSSLTMQGWFKFDITLASRRNSCNDRYRPIIRNDLTGVRWK